MRTTFQIIEYFSALLFCASWAIHPACDTADDAPQDLPPLLEFCYHQCSMGAHCDSWFPLIYEDETQCRLDCRDREQSEYKQCLEDHWPTEFTRARDGLNSCLLSFHKCTQWRAYYDSDPQGDASYPCKAEELAYLRAKDDLDEAAVYRACHEDENETGQ